MDPPDHRAGEAFGGYTAGEAILFLVPPWIASVPLILRWISLRYLMGPYTAFTFSLMERSNSTFYSLRDQRRVVMKGGTGGTLRPGEWSFPGTSGYEDGKRPRRPFREIVVSECPRHLNLPSRVASSAKRCFGSPLPSSLFPPLSLESSTCRAHYPPLRLLRPPHLFSYPPLTFVLRDRRVFGPLPGTRTPPT